MSAKSEAAVLPDEVWPSKSFPAPPTEHVLSHIANFLVKLGYHKTIKALNKEAQGKNVTSLDLSAGMVAKVGPLGRPLEDIYIDAFLQEDDFNDEIGPDPIAIPGGQEASSESDTSDSEEDEDTSSSEDSSDEGTDSGHATVVMKRKREETESESSSEDDSDDTDTDSEASSSDSEDISAAPPIKKVKLAREAPVDETETSDDSSEDSDSDDETSDSESDSSSDVSSEEEETSTTPTPVSAVKVAADQDSASESAASSSTLGGSLVKDSDNSGMHPARAERMAPSTQVAPHGQYMAKKSNVPFSRIPSTIRVDPRFSSNEYVSYDYADRAYQDLVVTKGKGFTKEKNKKKRGSYKGGFIDTAPKGIKFD